jgi:aspartyl-tRNA(Asn)/glutamyl-tRNA(Gln) amidotransferase subunit A
MKSYIEEFESIKKPGDYYKRIIEEIKRANEEFHAFNNIADEINSFPFSVKDNICVNGIETTASSKILKGYIPPFDATVVKKMKEKGFSFLGKTNMDEFGFGTFGINTEIPARNPFDKERIAGGSSSGAAVATALIKYHVAIAESTGGSISAPASFCGVVGFTPTYGLVSRYGLIDYANSLDKIGIMARSATDIKKVFDIIKGEDEHDSTSISAELPIKKKDKIVVIEEMLNSVDKSILDEFTKLLDKLKNLGYKIETISFPDLDIAGPTYYIIAMAEASTNLAKFNGFKYGYKVEDFALNYNEFFTKAREVFGEEAKRRIILGTYVRSKSVRAKYYEKALRIRRLLINKFKAILKDSFILSPTMPILPPRFDEIKELSPVQIYALDTLTIPPNLCGFPHISFPFAYIQGLPVGAQIIGDHFDDYNIISFVERWEEQFDYKFKYNIGEV